MQNISDFSLLNIVVKFVSSKNKFIIDEYVNISLGLGGIVISYNLRSKDENIVSILDSTIGTEPWLTESYPIFRFNKEFKYLIFFLISEQIYNVKKSVINAGDEGFINDMYFIKKNYNIKFENWNNYIIDCDNDRLFIGGCLDNNESTTNIFIADSLSFVCDKNGEIIGLILYLEKYYKKKWGENEMDFLFNFLSIVSLINWDSYSDEDNIANLTSLMERYEGEIFHTDIEKVKEDMRFLL